MRVLLGFDASAGAAQAAALIEGIEWPPESIVRVVAVLEPSATLMATLPPASSLLVNSDEIDAEITAYLESEANGVVRRLASAGLTTEGAVLRGRPATVLADEARTFAADVLVVGSRGHGAIASLVLGSVSGELVDHAPCPVLVARGATLERAVFASDGSPAATLAEDLLIRWPIFDDVSLRVVSVADVVHPWTTGIAPTMYRQVVDAFAKDLDAAKVEHQTIADGASERLRAAGRSADASVRVGDAAAEILGEGATWDADVIVLGSRGRTGLSRILLGSVARNVLLSSDKSVFIVREREGGAA